MMRSTTARLRRTSISPSSAACARGSVSRSWLGIRSARRICPARAKRAGGARARLRRQRIGRHQGGVGGVRLGQQRQRLFQLALVHRVEAAIVQQPGLRGGIGGLRRQLAGIGEQAHRPRRSGPRWKAAAPATSAPSRCSDCPCRAPSVARRARRGRRFPRRPDCPPGWRACRPSSARRTGRCRRS